MISRNLSAVLSKHWTFSAVNAPLLKLIKSILIILSGSRSQRAATTLISNGSISSASKGAAFSSYVHNYKTSSFPAMMSVLALN